jgi:hypothetical protein
MRENDEELEVHGVGLGRREMVERRLQMATTMTITLDARYETRKIIGRANEGFDVRQFPAEDAEFGRTGEMRTTQGTQFRWTSEGEEYEQRRRRVIEGEELMIGGRTTWRTAGRMRGGGWRSGRFGRIGRATSRRSISPLVIVISKMKTPEEGRRRRK